MDRLEIKATLSVDDAGTITGLAWPFGTADRVGDMIEKGAFTTPARVPMLFAHDQSQAVGVWDSIAETPEGLQVKGRLLVDDVARAREVRALVREHAVTGLSIGFITKKAKARAGGGRTISALELHEISIVAVPCHPGATITSIKAASDGPAISQGLDMNDEEKVAAPDIAALEQKVATVADDVKSVLKLTERVDKIEAKFNRPAAANSNSPTGDNDNSQVERKAFFTVMRLGKEGVEAEERKALTVATPASAGYLAPESFAAELIKLLKEFSPIRQYARVVTIGSPETKYPRRVGSPAAYWVGENDNRTASQGSYEQLSIKPHELATFTDVSNQLLEDNAYDLEGELRQEFAEAFATTEGTAFMIGTGDNDNQPTGLLTNGDIAEMITGHATAFPAANPADVLITMYHKLPTVHAQRGVWMMNRNTLATIRKWKDSDGRYLVIDPITTGMPTTMLGRPIVECLDMPDIGADDYPIVFGDLQGYRIVDRIQLQILRDPYTRATNGETRFHARRRTGGDVTHPDRFIKLKVAAA